MFNLALTLLITIAIFILISAIKNAYIVKSAIKKIKNKQSYNFILVNIAAALFLTLLLVLFNIFAVYKNIELSYMLASIIFILCACFIYVASIVTHDMGKLLEKLDTVRKLDPLTNVYNRGQIVKDIKNEFKRSKRYQRPATLAIIDINKFKSVNDTFGHQVGDDVILDLVKTVLKNIRKSDIFGRYGGDEFILLLPETNISRAKLLTDRLEEHIKNKKLMVNNMDIQYSISTGLAELSLDTNSYEEWINQADIKLLDIKHSLSEVTNY